MKLAWLVTLLILTGCGSAEKEEAEEGVFDPMVESIDKAKQVEDAALKHKEEMDKRLKEMEEASGNND